MSEVINLRQERKAKTRSQKEKNAAQNRIVHGQTKSEKRKKQLEAKHAARLLDGHKLEENKE